MYLITCISTEKNMMVNCRNVKEPFEVNRNMFFFLVCTSLPILIGFCHSIFYGIPINSIFYIVLVKINTCVFPKEKHSCVSKSNLKNIAQQRQNISSSYFSVVLKRMKRARQGSVLEIFTQCLFIISTPQD